MDEADACSRRSADDMELHDISRAPDAHGGARNNGDHITFANETLFEQALFGNRWKRIDFPDVYNVAR